MPTSPDGILTVTFDPERAAVQLQVDGAAWPTPVSRVTITRTSSGQGTIPVRDLERRAVAGGTLLWSDNEAPLGVDVTYSVVGYDSLGNEVGSALAVALAADAGPNIVAIGDSITEGTGATDVALRWQTLLQERLNPGGPTFPFIPAWPNTSAPGMPVTRTGSVRNSSNLSTRWGLGWRTAEVYADDGAIDFTFTGTSFSLMFVAAGTTGIMTVSVDGGAAVTIDTNSSVWGVYDLGAIYTIDSLTDTSHTVQVKRSPTSTAGQSVWISGLLTYRGDEIEGVRVLDAARHGINSTFWTVDANRPISLFGEPDGAPAGAVQGAGGAELIVYGVGTNDYAAGVSAATFGTNTRDLITAARANVLAPFTGTVVLIGMYLGGGRNAALWQTYHDELAAIASEDDRAVYMDMRLWMPAVDDDTEGLYVDTVHPSDAGYARMADAIHEFIASTTTAATVSTVGSAEGLWVKIPGRADMVTRVGVQDVGEMVRATLGGSWQVPGGVAIAQSAAASLAQSAGLGSLSTTLRVLSRDAGQTAALWQIIAQAPGQVVMLQTTPQPEELPSGYYQVVNPSQGTLSVRADLYGKRPFTLPITEAVMPAGSGTGIFGATHDDIAQSFTSHTEIAATVSSHLELAEGAWS